MSNHYNVEDDRAYRLYVLNHLDEMTTDTATLRLMLPIIVLLEAAQFVLLCVSAWN